MMQKVTCQREREKERENQREGERDRERQKEREMKRNRERDEMTRYISTGGSVSKNRNSFFGTSENLEIRLKPDNLHF